MDHFDSMYTVPEPRLEARCASLLADPMVEEAGAWRDVRLPDIVSVGILWRIPGAQDAVATEIQFSAALVDDPEYDLANAWQRHKVALLMGGEKLWERDRGDRR